MTPEELAHQIVNQAFEEGLGAATISIVVRDQTGREIRKKDFWSLVFPVAEVLTDLQDRVAALEALPGHTPGPPGGGGGGG